MTLNLTENKLWLVNCDYYQRASNAPACYSSLKSMIRMYECNSDSLMYIEDDFIYSNPIRSGNIYGVYLGSHENIQSIISTRTVTSLAGVKKIFFDPKSKYPRFKLNELTSIKRSLSPNKADVCVLPKDNICVNYSPEHRSGGDPRDEKVKILHSKSADAYYLIDHCPNSCYYSSDTKLLQKFIENGSTPGTVGIDKFLSALMNEGILPADCTVFYYGQISFLKDQETFERVDNILNNYMKVIYDTDLDKFINSNLQSITKDELESLSTMLQSSDPTVVGMGIKLISSYNIIDAACSIGILLSSFWNNISSNSAIKSVGFQQVLKTLGLNERSLYTGNKLKIINNLYKTSTNKEDKENAKAVVLEKIKSDLEAKWDYYKSSLDAIPMDFDFTLK